MQHKTLASAIEAIKNNQCSIKNDNVPCLQRACKYVWPDDDEPEGTGEFYYNLNGKNWTGLSYNPYHHFITATEFCRLMDEQAKPIDLGKVFDENSVLEMYTNNWFMTREKFIEVVSKLLTEKSKS